MVFSSRSISTAFLKWPAELLSNVLQCFPTPRASRRESDWFGLDDPVIPEDAIMGSLAVCLHLNLPGIANIIDFPSLVPRSQPESGSGRLAPRLKRCRQNHRAPPPHE